MNKDPFTTIEPVDRPDLVILGKVKKLMIDGPRMSLMIVDEIEKKEYNALFVWSSKSLELIVDSMETPQLFIINRENIVKTLCKVTLVND